MAVRQNADTELIRELGKALHEHQSIQPLLDRIEQRYIDELRQQEEADRQTRRRKRMGDLSRTSACLVRCWKNLNEKNTRYRIVKRNYSEFSLETYADWHEVEEEIRKYVEGEYEMNHWTWISREELYKNNLEELHIDVVPREERFELIGFKWTNKTTGAEMCEVFCYDRMLRLKSKSRAHSESFDIPVKEVFDETIGALKSVKEESDMWRFLNCRFEEGFKYYLNLTDILYFKITDLQVKETSWSSHLEGYKVSTEPLVLTSESTFVPKETNF